MQDEIYRTPGSELTDQDEGKSVDLLEFYVVSKKKFTILFFATVGYYAIYWFYRNWKLQKRRHNDDIWPIPRAIFSIFFAHSLFSNVEVALENQEKEYTWSPSTLATIYVLAQIFSNILDRLSYQEVGSPWTDIATIVVLPLLYFPLLSAQKAINISLGDPQGDLNKELTAFNIAWIIFGAMAWALVLMGIFVILGILQQ